ncbi:MAG: serine/threonine protein kinase [Polyangiaceae bacterium]|nr:serine/threonine protein kinase [Polyangiaceae bacterium]
MAQQSQRYRVIEKIASGGMAEVFRAESAGLEGFKKTVAIKRVLPHLSEKKQFIGMFLDEARLSAHLSHSNCVQVFDIGVGDNTYFIVMEYVDGADLKGVIEHQKRLGTKIPVEEACLICVRICEGLAYAHDARDAKGHHLHIVHRDMSPPNVLITRHGEVKITDFGLAKANSQLERSEPGIIKGKFSYLSPEAALGRTIDARTDVFAVGIILWELLAGRRLFMGDSDLETVRLVQSATVPPIRQFNPRVTPDIERVLSRALSQDPRDRYQTARAFGEDLNNMLFHLDRAVSSFDIAKLVEPVATERAARTRRKGGEKASLIGLMIEEVLFEFRSLDDADGGNGRVLGSAPLQIDAFDRDDEWASTLGNLGQNEGGAPRGGPAAQPTVERFNLAALEEDTGVGRRSVTDSQPPLADQLEESEPPRMPSHRRRVPSNSNATFLVLLVIVVLLGGLVGAYFAGAFSG